MKSLNSLPTWCIPVTIVAACAVFFAVAVHFADKPADVPGPAIAVHPGMYNFRAELAKHASEIPAAGNSAAAQSGSTAP